MTVEQMRLGRFEFRAMNNFLRRWIQKNVEFRIFKEHLAMHDVDLTGKAILDAGCGSGHCTELIAREFTPSRLVAFDLMPEQIALARERGLDADIFVGDMTDVDLPDGAFDAVFIFGVLHHIPEWRKALIEMARVLKPGGVLLVEEPKVRLDWPEFEQAIRVAGFEILEKSKVMIEYFQSYLCRRECT
jgi:ubiquinone/menaquinone biosynthesis C-methylase UbiE